MDLIGYKDYLIGKYPMTKTPRLYLDKMKTFFRHYPEFNQETANAYLIDLSKAQKIGTKNVYISVFQSYASYTGIDVKFGPNARTKITPKRKKSITIEELEENVLPYFSRLFSGDPEKRKFIVRFMHTTMLRKEEVFNLKANDIDFANNRIEVHGKGNKWRTVKFHKFIKDDIEKYVRECQRYDNKGVKYAFDITYGYIDYIFLLVNTMLQYRRRVGKTLYEDMRLTPHMLRHSGAKKFYKETRDIRGLQKLLGHSSLQTTQDYLDYAIEDVEDSYKKVKYRRRK